jgi:hypothetical protein
VFPLFAHAFELKAGKTFEWDFVAPSIYDTANLPQAASGLIVYDSKTDSFYAKGPGGSSDWRAFSQNFAVAGTRDLGTCNTSKVVDWATGAAFKVTLTNGATCVFDFDNVADGQTITIWVTNGASTGTGVVTWPTAKWQGGTPPTMTTGASALDVCTFTANGSTVAGSCVQDMQ